jgi:hypothetical protein
MSQTSGFDTNEVFVRRLRGWTLGTGSERRAREWSQDVRDEIKGRNMVKRGCVSESDRASGR